MTVPVFSSRKRRDGMIRRSIRCLFLNNFMGVRENFYGQDTANAGFEHVSGIPESAPNTYRKKNSMRTDFELGRHILNVEKAALFRYFVYLQAGT